MITVDALIVARNLNDILPQTIKALKTYPFNKVITILAIPVVKPKWIDILTVDKGKLGSARNTGVNLSKATFVCMIDEDIILTPKYVENLLKNFKIPQVAAAGGKLKSLTSNAYAQTKAQVFRGYCKTHSDLPCGGTIYRTTTLKKKLFNPDLTGGEDHELHTRLKKQGFKVIFDDSTCCFHHFKGSMKKEVFLCMFSGARIGFFQSLLRAAISPLRSLILSFACKDNIYSLLIPPFYITQWIAHVAGAFFTEQQVKTKMQALN
jgi:cellulose synthase/poly-beta-1,6-N-acetylglucosamine synthase-like glycosyltransferase